jgi:hypothetical protein
MPITTASPTAPMSFQSQGLTQTRDGDRHLDRGRTDAAHCAHAIAEIARHTLEVMRRYDDPSRITAHDGGEVAARLRRAPFDIHVLGARVERLRKNARSLFLRAVEPPAFPGRPARGDRRHTTTLQRARNVDVADTIETQFDHVPVGRPISRPSRARPSFGRSPSRKAKPSS